MFQCCNIEDEEIDIWIYDRETDSVEPYDVEKVGKNLYKLTNNHPLDSDFSYGTIIEVETSPKETGKLFFKRIYKNSDYKHQRVMRQGLCDSDFRLIGDMIRKAGGFAEILFGIGHVSLPKDSTLDVSKEIVKMIRAKENTSQK